jgi:HK97 family phage prohead protease
VGALTNRTVAGLALPYDRVVRANRRRLMFAHGGVEWPPRLRVVREHSAGIRLGRTIGLGHAGAGLRALLELDDNPAGHRALARIVDGTERGLSCGLDFLDATPHPTLPGVLLVLRARLREITITRAPAAPECWITVWPGC